VDTSAEGTYQFVLTVNKKGLQERQFTFTGVRSYTDTEREEKLRSSAKKMTYANLPKTENKGKMVVETGYLTGDVEQSINEWVVTMAMTKTNNDNYKDIVYLICTEEPAWAEGTQIRVYGQASGTYSVLTDDGNIKSYPRIDVSILEKAD
jgi:hypothetical protein